jgi:hypothetical protein
MPPSRTQLCEVCNKEFSKANISRHKQIHDIVWKPKGLQEYCNDCQEWFAYHGRKYHYQRKHNGKAPPSVHEAYVIDPATYQRKTFRPIGPNSKHFTRQRHKIPPPDQLSSPDQRSSPGQRSSLDQRSSSQQLSPPAAHTPNSSSVSDRESGFAAQLIEEVRESNERLTETMRYTIQRQLEEATSKAGPATRLRTELPEYAAAFNNSRPGQPITAQEYLALAPPEERQSHDYRYVVCTSKEARRILQRGLISLPVLIPHATEPRQSLADFREWLKTKNTVEIQDMGQEDTMPVQVSGKAAAKRLCDNGLYPINLLDVSCCVENAVPDCLRGLHAFDSISQLNGSGHAGKQTVFRPNDLTNSATFSLASQAGVFSAAHRDSYGKMTSIFIECGAKCWLTWPALSPQEVKAWVGKGPQSYPDVDAFPICLEEGDLLLQPPGTIHAPYTYETCVVTGTQHWHSPSMHIHLRLANEDAQYEMTTNEDEAYEAVYKIATLRRVFEEQNPRFPPPSPQDMIAFDMEAQVSPFFAPSIASSSSS